MPQSIVVTGKYVLLPDVEDPSPATIVINKESGKITEIERAYIARGLFEKAHPTTSIANWIDAGAYTVIPGLVEYVASPCCDAQLHPSPPSCLAPMCISMSLVAPPGKVSGPALELPLQGVSQRWSTCP